MECFLSPHVFPWTVAFADTDAGGVVYYTRYLEFAERARAAWLEDTSGFSNAVLWEKGIIFAVQRMEVKFIKPARLSHILAIQTQIIDNTGVRLKIVQKIFHDESLLVDIIITLACLTVHGTPQRIPQSLQVHLPATPHNLTLPPDRIK